MYVQYVPGGGGTYLCICVYNIIGVILRAGCGGWWAGGRAGRMAAAALTRTRTALLFCTSDTSVRPVVPRTRDGPICRDNGAPTVPSI